MSGWVAGAVVVAGVAGAAISSNAAKSAAQTQANAAYNAQNIQQQDFNTVLGNEAPFVQTGQEANSQLAYLLGVGGQNGGGTGLTGNSASGPGAKLGAGSSSAGGYGSLNAPFTASTFKSMTPAYNFQLQQGAQGTLNQDSGAQGAESGAAMKDLVSYNQNYANTSFNNAFQQYTTQQNNVFGRLNSLATLGQGAASNQATGASTFAGNIGQSAQNVGSSLAAGQIGSANAIAGGINNAAPWLYAGSQGGQSNNGYATNGGFVYNGVEQNGGYGGGIGNIVDEVP